MSFQDIKKSINSVFEERLTSPLYGSFIISWLIWNWKIVYLTIFVSQDSIAPINKIDYILSNYKNWWNILLYPTISAILLVVAVPWLANWAFKIYLHYEKERISMREQLDAGKRLTFAQSAAIRNSMNQAEIEQERQIEKREIELKIFKEQINQLNQEKSDFRILFARYGKNETYNDVTTIIDNLIKTKPSFLVKNSELGSDPLPYFHKELFIVYNLNNSVHSISVKEYYEIEKDQKTGRLISKVTTEAESAYYSTIESLFPGLWKLKFSGKINGEEEVKILEGNKYFAKDQGDKDFIHSFDLENVLIDLENNSVSFLKKGVLPDDRKTPSKLNITKLGEHYEGDEENGDIKVTYSKIA